MIVSTELDEVIELADRIAVLYKGRLVGIVPAGTGRDVLGLMMAGVSPDEAQADAAGKHPAPSRSENPAGTQQKTRQKPRPKPRNEPGARRPVRAGAPLRRRRRPP